MARKQRPDDDGPALILTGRVKNVISEKGFGFIRTDDGREYFFHKSSAPEFDALDAGTAVTFVPTTGAKGPRAESVAIA